MTDAPAPSPAQPAPDTRPVAVVTGASSGIGAATARALSTAGFRVVCAARRRDRIERLAAEIDGVALTCDVTDPASVTELAASVRDRCDLLINNAGGAIGLEPVAEADLKAWQAMYATNVLGAAAVTKALLPNLIKNSGQIVFITSTAADAGYEGGAGYCAAKAGERSVVQSLRLELFDQPVRIAEIAPGMVRTDEFSLTRFGGDEERAEAVYQGVAEPLVAEDIADCVAWIASRPGHVNIDRMVVRPRAQAAQHKVHRS
ncbi:SDR family NAD(P)-dependent oxidoreductase [Microlunatus panaciterrae]|uniref:NADP-dependent 3-hydroxy acid dehydrogenase YdfG n=1 Tax=Microlunatus panaciterrae TaxID=400768 RepID=A0ABS2RH27_9ACTN|nr:SDR family NAD(P)-dependent oxidoreductase [Microlunatus panaciterrae]MBM7798310.1 NADP-dependent 3-hydroxy acid dehydrogenase YdfG [Microlunatus panaciterrae]